MKYTPGMLVGQLSRSAGNTTASHNRFGAYLRNRTIPVNPNTAIQTTRRTKLGGLSSAYRQLTPQQRTDWGSLGALLTRVDSLGQSYSLTGLQAYVGLNINRALIGGAALSAAPPLTIPSVPLTLVPTIAAGTPALSLAFTATPVPSSVKYVIYATAQVSAGRRFMPRSAFRYIAKVSAAGASPYDALAEYVAKFGTLVAGYKIFFRILAMRSDYGFVSTVLDANAIVAA